MGLPRGHFFRQCRHQASTARREFPFPEHQLRVSYCYEEGLQITIRSRCYEHPRNPKKSGKARRSFEQDSKGAWRIFGKRAILLPAVLLCRRRGPSGNYRK